MKRWEFVAPTRGAATGWLRAAQPQQAAIPLIQHLSSLSHGSSDSLFPSIANKTTKVLWIARVRDGVRARR